MTRQQLRRRYTWRGAGLALLVFTLWMFASSYAAHITQ